MNDNIQALQLTQDDILGETKETSPEKLHELRESDEYKSLVEDIKSDLTETLFGINSSQIEMNHRIGKRISEETSQLFNRQEVYGKVIIATVAQDINWNQSKLYRAIQFYKWQPNLEAYMATLPKNVSFNKIVTENLRKDLGKRKPTLPIKFTWDRKNQKYKASIEDYQALEIIDFSSIKEDLITYLQGLA